MGIIKNPKNESSGYRLLIGTPTRGSVRMEWVIARYGQTIPCNWSMGQVLQAYDPCAPVGFTVPDAQNLIVREAVQRSWEWLLFIEDDTCPPPDAFCRINEYMVKGDIPVVSGLYYLKSMPPEPLVYRGRGNGYFGDFKVGDKVWVDGVPTGFLLINGSILRLMWEESEEYVAAGNQVTRRVFDNPSRVWFDPETNEWSSTSGTTDLNWCTRVIEQDVLRRSGWAKIGKRKYPFLVDTNILCHHITTDGQMFPPPNVTPNAKRLPKTKTPPPQ